MNRAARNIVAGAALAVAGLASSSALAANEPNFCDFSNTAQINSLIQRNGDAVVSGAQIHLTPSQQNKSGSAYYKKPFAWGPNTSFSTHFRFKLYPNTGSTGGSGFTFMLQNKSVTAVGSSGGGLGYNGIGSSMAVVFDTHQDSGDPSGDYVGVAVAGHPNTILASTDLTSTLNLKSGSEIDAWIDYDGTSDALNVYLAPSPAAKPGSPVLSTTVDVFAQVGSQAYAGFSGATSASETNNQDIDYWVMNNDGTPLTDCIPCTSDTQCAATPSTPACQPSGFCGQCSATNSSQCTGSTPVCIVSAGQCGGCNSNADCGGNTPVCNTTTHLCQGCTGDSDCSGSTPACQMTGPLAGSCTECSATNTGQCGGPTPVCLAGSGVCGCSTSTDCGPNQICQGTPPVCVPGCITGTKDCQSPLTCTVQDGGVGQCTNSPDGGTGTCTSNNDCTAPLGVCTDPDGGTCVQCLTMNDCGDGGLLCNPTNNSCVECIPSDGGASGCSSTGSGSVCLPNGSCGCVVDSDCGDFNSGRVCDDDVKVCVAGCRGIDGNGCPVGQICSSTNTTIGQCVPVGPDGGPLTDGGSGDGGHDAGLDGSKDGSSDGSATDGSANQDGSFADGSNGDGSSGDGGLNADGSVVEGGGCSCSFVGGEDGSLQLGGLLSLGAVLSAWARRRRRRDRAA